MNLRTTATPLRRHKEVEPPETNHLTPSPFWLSYFSYQLEQQETQLQELQLEELEFSENKEKRWDHFSTFSDTTENFYFTFTGGGAKLVGPADEALTLPSRSSFYTITGKTAYGGLLLWKMRVAAESEDSDLWLWLCSCGETGGKRIQGLICGHWFLRGGTERASLKYRLTKISEYPHIERRSMLH